MLAKQSLTIRQLSKLIESAPMAQWLRGHASEYKNCSQSFSEVMLMKVICNLHLTIITFEQNMHLN